MLAVLAAGFAAGCINTIIGSGSLITFPTLVAIGYPSVLANVSNTVGLWPGSVSGAIGYRRELSGQRRRVVILGTASAVGALVGGVLLLTLPPGVFSAVVPILVLLACLLIGVQPWLVRRLAGAGRTDRMGAATVGSFCSAVYGGYFGAAQGVILVAILGVVLDEPLQRVNALKNVLAALDNVTAAVRFVLVSHVAWLAAVLIAMSSIAGGQVGAAVGRRIPAIVLRWVIVVVGIAVAIFLIVRDH